MISSVHNMINNIGGKWNRLKAFAMETETNVVKAYYIAFTMAVSIMFVQLKSKVITTQSDNKVGKNTYVVEYKLLGKKYKMIAKQRKGPCPITDIVDENGDDIMERVLPYMGPGYDWHGTKQHPPLEIFNCTEIKITYLNGTTEILK